MKVIFSTIAATFLFANMAQALPRDFTGTWNNTNRNTRNIVRVVITENPTTHALSLRAFGACTPTPCDMGVAPLVTYGRSITDRNHRVGTALYNLGFKRVIVVLQVSGRNMSFETYNEFTDGSGRQNYWTSERMREVFPDIADTNESLNLEEPMQ